MDAADACRHGQRGYSQAVFSQHRKSLGWKCKVGLVFASSLFLWRGVNMDSCFVPGLEGLLVKVVEFWRVL
jgi:hypothetical protein